MAGPLAWLERRRDLDPPQVAERKQRPFDTLARGHRVIAQRVEKAVHHRRVDAHAIVGPQRDLSDPALEHLQHDDAVLQRLFGHEHLGQEQPLSLQGDLDVLGGILEIDQGLAVADVARQQWQQRLRAAFIEAGQAEARHPQGRAADQRGGDGPRQRKVRRPCRRRGLGRRRHLLHQAAGSRCTGLRADDAGLDRQQHAEHAGHAGDTLPPGGQVP